MRTSPPENVSATADRDDVKGANTVPVPVDDVVVESAAAKSAAKDRFLPSNPMIITPLNANKHATHVFRDIAKISLANAAWKIGTMIVVS